MRWRDRGGRGEVEEGREGGVRWRDGGGRGEVEEGREGGVRWRGEGRWRKGGKEG